MRPGRCRLTRRLPHPQIMARPRYTTRFTLHLDPTLLDESAAPTAVLACANPDHGPRLASCSEQRLGCGCGANAASIMRRWLARSPSSDGGRMPQATDCGPAHAARVAAAKAPPFSVQAGPAITSVSIRFQLAMLTRAAGSGKPSPLDHEQPHKQDDHDCGCDAVDSVLCRVHVAWSRRSSLASIEFT
jgi:hypothetical protein